MADDLAALETWLDPLLAALEPGPRARLAGAIAGELQRANRARIRANVEPEGGPMAPRRPQLRARAGRIKRGAMFRKLGGSLDAISTADVAVLQFAGAAGRIAALHHHGGSDLVRPTGPVATYLSRRLLGLPAADVERIKDLTLAHLTRSD